MTALHQAAAHGNTAVVALLLANNANANAQTIRGKTPLMYAAENNNLNCLLLLLQNGAKALIQDSVRSITHFISFLCS